MKKILVIADRPGWAYHEIQKFITESFRGNFDFYTDFLLFNLKNKKSVSVFKNIKGEVKKFILRKKYQKLSKDNYYDLVIFLGFYFREQMKVNFSSKYTVFGIYTDGFPPSGCSLKEPTPNEFLDYYLSSNVDALVCGSQLIKEFYSKYFENTFYANLALNFNVFKNDSEPNINKYGLKIGWTGNPRREFKHYYDIILPAIERVKAIRSGIEFFSRFSGPINTLPNFYKNIDIVLIASDKDAGPSLFSEAALMNVPSISTKVGHPFEVIKHMENGILVDNKIDSFVDAIIKIYDNKELLLKMKQRIREDTIKILGKKESIRRWQELFNFLNL